MGLIGHHAEVQYQCKSSFTTEEFYDKGTSEVQINGNTGEWFRTIVELRQ